MKAFIACSCMARFKLPSSSMHGRMYVGEQMTSLAVYLGKRHFLNVSFIPWPNLDKLLSSQDFTFIQDTLLTHKAVQWGSL
ncbi:hypothetical protein F383_27098 [Gossypium arboreum]|uniref:Uncharacterized protein n=1 Tax=Gossypium arboreum TaxID=29729 RepID=A0A0B0P417_GOSAR|nr:hypothetical protein F383_27098 [Gossypium arboreum]